MKLVKTCNCCKQTKPASLVEFVPNKECVNGIGSYCRPCSRNIQREYKRRHSAKIAARRRELYAERYGARQRELERIRARQFPFKVAAENLMNGVYGRAKQRNLPLAQELRNKKFVVEWLTGQPNCECCEKPLWYGPKGGQKHDSSPSFDQIVPGAGYELSNTALICWRCNNLKRNYNTDDLRLVAAWIDRKMSTNEVVE